MQGKLPSQMKIVAVFRRPSRDDDPEETNQIFLRAGQGIDGDCHANPVSPRQLLIVSTGAYEYCNVPPLSLRENILVNANDLKLSSGSLLRIGPTAAVRITFECEPCGRLNRFRPGLSKDVRSKRGYLGRVIRSGVVKPGYRIKVEDDVFEAFSDDWRDRLISVIHKLPTDCIVSYSQLAELAGVPKVFCRAFPGIIRKQQNLPWQRVLPSSQLTRLANLPRQLDGLERAIFDDETSQL